MTTYFAQGTPETDYSLDDMRSILTDVFDTLGPREKVLAVPPDMTRVNSMAGPLTCMAYDYYKTRMTDVMPALGTHFPMEPWQLEKMFPTVPRDLIRDHDWRNDVLTVGHVPSEYVTEVTEGIYEKEWPVQINRMLWEGGHDLILSIGQVVPHEVIGMANYNKNIFIGTGGSMGINESHFIGAAYGMERMMGRHDTPLRRILNYADEKFCSHLPVLYILTVIGPREDGSLAMRGLYIGDDVDCFEQASKLSVEVNFIKLDEPPKKMVVYLDPEEFQSIWLGNKSIYRTRMAIADGGELIVMAPNIGTFGEDPEIDAMLRKYGYRGTDGIMKYCRETDDLPNNLSAAAHLIHGSSEGRFTITYCPGKLSREEIESVGFQFGDVNEMMLRYPPETMTDGWNTMPDGEKVFYISNPALGLWASKDRLQDR